MPIDRADCLVIFRDVFEREPAVHRMDSLQGALRAAQKAIDDYATMDQVYVMKHDGERYRQVAALSREEDRRIYIEPPESELKPEWITSNQLADRMRVTERAAERWAADWPDTPPVEWRRNPSNGAPERLYDWNVWRRYFIDIGYWDSDVEMTCMPTHGLTIERRSAAMAGPDMSSGLSL